MRCAVVALFAIAALPSVEGIAAGVVPGDGLADTVTSMRDYVDVLGTVDALGPANVRVLVFSAGWCQPCQVYKRIIAGLPPAARDRIAIIDIDAFPALAADYGVTNIPASVVLRPGETGPIEAGVRSAQDLVRWIEDGLVLAKQEAAARAQLRASAVPAAR